ncbi:MAG: sigma-70 family RNA polymerase sigma factor, partial [Myxococcota bacterium]
MTSVRPSPGASRAEIERAVEQLHRRHYRGLVAPLIRMVGGFAQAEEVVQDAYLRAFTAWSERGLPDEPLAWLRTTVRRSAIDRYRSRGRRQSRDEAWSDLRPSSTEAELDFDEVGDDVLRLIFTCCHPSLAPEAQVGLTLKTVCGLTTEEVARAFLLKPTTLAQRLVRAKKKIASAG